jgi:3-mercaptopyruvate sulfurtransferase SseA
MHRTITLFALCALTGVAGAQYKTSSPNAKPIPAATVPPAPTAEQSLAKVRRISETETDRLFKNGSAVIVDVRSNAQYQLGHIKGSVNIPGSQLMSRIRELSPRKTIITYCA